MPWYLECPEGVNTFGPFRDREYSQLKDAFEKTYPGYTFLSKVFGPEGERKWIQDCPVYKIEIRAKLKKGIA